MADRLSCSCPLPAAGRAPGPQAYSGRGRVCAHGRSEPRSGSLLSGGWNCPSDMRGMAPWGAARSQQGLRRRGPVASAVAASSPVHTSPRRAVPEDADAPSPGRPAQPQPPATSSPLTRVMSREAAAALMCRLGCRTELLQSRARAKVPTELGRGGGTFRRACPLLAPGPDAKRGRAHHHGSPQEPAESGPGHRGGNQADGKGKAA